MPDTKEGLQEKLAALRLKLEAAEQLLAQGKVDQAEELFAVEQPLRGYIREHTQPTQVPEGSRIIEGVFDGQHMMGGDGKQYLVPPNYASKSKLVEGDLLKLSITLQGAFIYKQISPIGRKRIVCTLIQQEGGMWEATDGVHHWRLLTAAVTYFKGKAGDEVVILVPGDAPSRWAAVENIIAK